MGAIAPTPQFLADQLALIEPREQIMLTTLLPAQLADLFQYPFDQLSWILHFEVLISDYSFVLPPVYGQIKLSKSKIGKNRSSGHAKS